MTTAVKNYRMKSRKARMIERMIERKHNPKQPVWHREGDAERRREQHWGRQHIVVVRTKMTPEKSRRFQ